MAGGGLQRGTNEAGVNGLLDITGAGKQFHVLVESWGKDGKLTRKVRVGRGNAGYETSRPLFEITTLLIRGKDNPDGWPEPNNLRNASGTVTLTYHTSEAGTAYKASYPVEIDASSIAFNDKAKDNWAHSVVCRVTGAPTWSGWPSTQPNPSAPSYVDLELYEGTSKSLDPNDLATQAQRRTDAVNIADNDAAEAAKLAAMAAAAALPMTGLKLRGINFTRTDKLGGDVVEDWQKNDTVDDYELPETWVVSDTNNIASQANGGTIDGTPSTPVGYVLRTSKTLTVKTGHTFTTREFGLRTTAEDITMPGTTEKLDPLEIESTAQDTDVYRASEGLPAAPDPPADELQLTSTSITQINQLMSKRVVEFKVLNSEQERTYPRIKTTDDAENVEDEAVRAAFWDVGDTPPALPVDFPTNNVKLVNFTDVPITPAKNMRVWLFGPKNSDDERVLPNYETTADASNLQATAVRAALDGDSISDPAGYVVRKTITRPITLGLGVNRTLTIKEYGLRTTKADIENPGTWAKLDPKAIESEGRDTDVYATLSGVPAAPSVPSAELQIVATKTEVINTLMSQRTVDFDVLNSEQKRTYPKIETRDDANDLNDHAIRAEIWDTGSLPSLPTDTPTGAVKLIHKIDQPTTPGKTMRVWIYGPLDSIDEVETPHNVIKTDANLLDSEKTIADVFTTGAPPSTPSAPSGLKLDYYIDKKLTDTYSVRIYRWALQNSADRVTQPKTTRSIDPSNLHTEATVAAISSATIASVPADLVTVETDSVQLGDGKLLTITKKGLRTNEQAVEFDGTEVAIGVATHDNMERLVEIEDCLASDTLEDLLAAKWAIIAPTTSPTQGYPWNNTRARRYTPTKVIYTTTFALPGLVTLPPTDKIRISGSITPIIAKTWLGLDGSGVPSVWVARSQSRGSGKHLIQLAQFEAQGVGGPLYVRQRITNTTPTLGTSSILKVNDAPFLGFPTGTVMYCGASYDVVISDTSSTYDMTYIFQVQMSLDLVAFPTIKGIPPGGIIIANSSETPGLVPGTGGPPTYSWSNMGLEAKVPDQDAFSFTTWTQ